MGSARQLVRWSLPGLVMVLNVCTLHAGWIAIFDGRSPSSFISSATAPALIALVAGGLPAGFLLYQLYLSLYRPVGGPRFREWWFPLYYRRDRGGSVLALYCDRYRGNMDLLRSIDAAGENVEAAERRIAAPQFRNLLGVLMQPTEHLDVAAASSDPPGNSPAWKCKRCAQIYTDRCAENWTLLQSLIDYCSGVKGHRWLKLEYTSGSDLYHAMGAAQTAVIVSVVGSVAYNLVTRQVLSARALPAMPDGIDAYALFLAFAFTVVSVQFGVLRICRGRIDLGHSSRIAAALAFASKSPEPPEVAN